MKALILATALALIGQHLHAQFWEPLGRGILGGSTSVKTLYGDDQSDRLLAGGTFNYILNESDTVLGVGQAAWNGTRWDSLAARIQPIGGTFSAGQTYWFLRFQENLYACGGFVFLTDNNEVNEGLARLNENTQRWEALECINPGMSGILTLVPKEPQGTLYATGYTGTLCGYPLSCVFRYDGQAFHIWEPFEQIPQAPGNYVGVVFDFQGYTYMTGSFRNPNGPGLAYFMRYTGSSWEQVPGWGPNTGPIKDILIRNNILYVVGAFKMSQGAPGNLATYFDGQSWHSMGGGLRLTSTPMSEAAVDVEWWNGNLYVCGQFNEADGIAVNKIAKWNGQQWCGLPGAFNSNDGYITDMTVWRNDLYMCGAFNSLDGEPIRDVARWIGGETTTNCSAPVGVHEIVPASSLALLPMGTPGMWELKLPTDGPWTIAVVDATGREVLSTRTPQQSLVLDLQRPAPGLYVLRASQPNGRLLSTKLAKP